MMAAGRKRAVAALRIGATLGLTSLLSACGGLGSGLDVFTRPGIAPTQEQKDAFLPPETARPSLERQWTCPSITVLDGAAAWRVGRPGGGASEVAHQASVRNLARECEMLGNTLRIRVGVEGLLKLGPLGRPGTFAVPVRVVAKRRDAVVAQQLTRVSVTIPSGESQADFVHVEERLVLPVSANDPGDEYELFVGFDPSGEAARLQRARR